MWITPTPVPARRFLIDQMHPFPTRDPESSATTICAAEHGVIANNGQDDSAALQSIIDSLPIDLDVDFD